MTRFGGSFNVRATFGASYVLCELREAEFAGETGAVEAQDADRHAIVFGDDGEWYAGLAG
jgi:hypothetical protein